MGKPSNPYTPGTKLRRIFDGDWSKYTAKEIAKELNVSTQYFHAARAKIKAQTGYSVPYLRKREGYRCKEFLTLDLKKWNACFHCAVKKDCYICACSGNDACKEPLCNECKDFSNFTPSNFCKFCGRPLTERARMGYASNLKDYIEFLE